MSLREHLAVEQGMNYPIPKVADRLPYYLGSITLFGIIIQIATGVYLLQFYNPDHLSAHQSVLYIVSRARLGDFVRSIHRWTLILF
jgi:quinol-cytochrome oxidoreductase complex cytochrome b subunit